MKILNKSSENDQLTGHFQSFFIYYFSFPLDLKKNPVNQLIKKIWPKQSRNYYISGRLILVWYNRMLTSWWRHTSKECLVSHILSEYHLSHGMRFPTIWHFDKCRLGRASAASFYMVFIQSLNNHRILKQLTKALIRLRVCAGWSEALLVAHTWLLGISCTGSFC